MHLVFLSDNMNFSGGRKLLFEYAQHTRQAGNDTKVLVKEQRGGLTGMLETTVVKDFSADSIPDCDLIIASSPGEVLDAYASKKAPVVHFCQGYEITDLEQRLRGEALPSRYQGGGIINTLKIFKKKFSWRRKISTLDRIYRLPTHLITVSAHLKDELEKRYGRKVILCRNGVHTEYFYPPAIRHHRIFTREDPLRVINIGPLEVSFKGIPVTFKAVDEARKAGLHIKFIRVSPCFSDSERKRKSIDEFHESLSQRELGELLRNSDVYISNSLEGEGFGLPAMEALSCGLPCILSDISSYKNFSSRSDFCLFVPQNSHKATSSALEKICRMSAEDYCRIGRNAIEVSKNFSHENACAEFERHLNSIISAQAKDNAPSSTASR
ncbi:MAG TPA: hypothetical protein DET40_23510 [Lentisphaeria bacterium]|nr:MAG: hypothetical protein A2X45_23725 [Lentisphaerae bacterium GWF2_50_93]HCE46524.1 hypothetical protein [Lentisphaeria bacterium]